MAIQKTLSIIKPDAVARNKLGQIYVRLEQAGLQIVAAKMRRLTFEEAGRFYALHKGKPFFNQLIQAMCAGPVMVQVLEGEEAIGRYRALMGATDPKCAMPGTLRADFAVDMHNNAVHGSDSMETAMQEIAFFFKENEIFSQS